MPETVRVWSDQRLSADQVRHLIVAHDTNPALFSEQDPSLVEAVEPLGVLDTGRAVTYWRQAVNEAAFEKDAAELHDMRRVHLSKTFEGMGRLDGWLDPLSFEIVKSALDGATVPPTEGEDRTPAQRRADALVDIARLALDEGRLPEKGGEKPHLLVMVSLDQLTGRGCGPSQGLGETVDGTVPFPKRSRLLVMRLLDLAPCHRAKLGAARYRPQVESYTGGDADGSDRPGQALSASMLLPSCPMVQHRPQDRLDPRRRNQALESPVVMQASPTAETPQGPGRLGRAGDRRAR